MTRFDSRHLVLTGTFTLGLLGSACSSAPARAATPASPPLAERSIRLAQPCKALRDRLTTSEPRAFFVEVARVQPPIQEPVADVLARGPVAANPLASVLLNGAQPVSGPWSVCQDAGCRALRDGTLTLEMVERPAHADGLIELRLSASWPGGAVERASLRTRDQVPVAVALPKAAGSASIVVTPYYMAEADGQSRRALLECQRAGR